MLIFICLEVTKYFQRVLNRCTLSYGQSSGKTTTTTMRSALKCNISDQVYENVFLLVCYIAHRSIEA